MKDHYSIIVLFFLLGISCTSEKKLSYLYIPQEAESQIFRMALPDYKLQPRDILYITAKAITPDGSIKDLLSSTPGGLELSYVQSESGGYLAGYEINTDGDIILPAIGKINLVGLTINESREKHEEKFRLVFKEVTVDCKLISFKFTVIGEVRAPGNYLNYNNYLTVLEAIGRAGGIGDYGRRDKVLVVRSTKNGTTTYTLNLQNKNLLSSEAYYLLPNDIVIVEPEKHKIFNMNLPTLSFIITSAFSIFSTTLLLINYIQ
jgi:polysaccharide export outer membrane protein